MSLLNDFSLKARLAFLVASFSILLVIIGFLATNAAQKGANDLSSIYTQRLVPSNDLNNVMEHLQAARTQILLSLQHDPKSEFSTMHDHPLGKHLDAIHADLDTVKAVLDGFMAGDLSADERRSAESFIKIKDAYLMQGIHPAMKALHDGAYRRANEILLTQINPLYADASKQLDNLLSYEIDTAKSDYESALGEIASLRTIILVVLLLGLGINGFLAYVTVKGIGSAVDEIDGAMTRLAKGDLTSRTNYHGKDELGHIAKSFNGMGETFQNIVKELSSATSQLASAAEETSSITEETNQNLGRQQHEIDQVATAMNEMNATVHEVANNASLAADAAHNADEEAAKGKRVVGQTIDVIETLANEVEETASAIRTLASESDRISTVLDVIRGIAEQTNLLALNAAIEAARAGEQGRGFAVVADEVRTLAQRTQQATEEIHTMIEGLQGGTANAVNAMEKSQSQAQAGVQQAAEAGTSLEAIMAAVDTINEMNSMIASAAEEQSAVAEEINKNINNISHVSEETTEGARQTATASEQLARLAEELQSLVGRFQV